MRKITTEFEYRKISEERCKEIDSWEIHDPYGYGTLFTAKKYILWQTRMSQFFSVKHLCLDMMM